MKLHDRLRERKTAGRGGLAADEKATFEGHAAVLRRSGMLESIARVGERVSDFTLLDHRGAPWNLQAALRAGPVILKFYRGTWCPYCSLELREYRDKLPRIRERGATFVAISPEKPQASEDFLISEQLEFPVLSDPGNVIAGRFGLAFTPEPGLMKLMQSHGIDLAEKNSDGRWTLPIPGIFVLSAGGRIVYSYAEPDFAQRADPDDVLAAIPA